jgi:DNA excision repair protein ERCC-2
VNLEEFFPYNAFRTGQIELAKVVHEASVSGNRLVVEAMNGFGKTVAVLCGSLLAAHENNRRIVYLCRTKRQVFRVMEEISEINKKVHISSAHLFSKFDYCLLKKYQPSISSNSFRWYCSFNVTNNLCSYFLNANLLLENTMSLANDCTEHFIPHQSLLKKSEDLHICPYEVVRLTTASAQIIVATYHYLFEEASKSVLFANTQFDPGRTIVIFDEAHNLRDFIRDSTSSSLSLDELRQSAIDSQALFFTTTSDSLALLYRRIENYCSRNNGWYVDKGSFIQEITCGMDTTWLPNLAYELTACTGAAWYSISTGRRPPLSVMKVGEFLPNLLTSTHDENVILTKSPSSIMLVNADPTKAFVAAIEPFWSVILLSATINPSELFLKSLGLEESSVMLHKAQASDSFRIKTILDTEVTTKFKSRTPIMYSKIAEKLVAIILASTGGVGIFVPSYVVLEAVRELIGSSVHGRNIVVESRNLTNEEANELMESFKTVPNSVLLGVQGGRFSEGEDFRDRQMNISVVVGLALPPPSPATYAEYAYLNRINARSSYLTVSLLPALRKAFQSAGRHIRNPNKKGLVFLLDSRFRNKSVLDLMPTWLTRNLVMGSFTLSEISQIITEFNSD